MININTQIYGSLSEEASAFECKIFNIAFQYYDINAIFKPFEAEKVFDTIDSTMVLGFQGINIGASFKKDVLDYVDSVSKNAEIVGAADTIINKNGEYVAYNIDYTIAKGLLRKTSQKEIVIIGTDGFVSALKVVAEEKRIKVVSLNNNEFNSIKYLRNSLVYDFSSNSGLEIHNSNRHVAIYKDNDLSKKIEFTRASRQFKLYTGKAMPLNLD